MSCGLIVGIAGGGGGGGGGGGSVSAQPHEMGGRYLYMFLAALKLFKT